MYSSKYLKGLFWPTGLKSRQQPKVDLNAVSSTKALSNEGAKHKMALRQNKRPSNQHRARRPQSPKPAATVSARLVQPVVPVLTLRIVTQFGGFTALFQVSPLAELTEEEPPAGPATAPAAPVAVPAAAVAVAQEPEESPPASPVSDSDEPFASTADIGSSSLTLFGDSPRASGPVLAPVCVWCTQITSVDRCRFTD